MSMGLRPPTGLLFTPQVIYIGIQQRWNDIVRGRIETRRKASSSATLSNTNPTWADPGPDLDLSSESSMTNCLSHGTIKMYFNLLLPSMSRSSKFVDESVNVIFIS
jgi:hypothetical protein